MWVLVDDQFHIVVGLNVGESRARGTQHDGVVLGAFDELLQQAGALAVFFEDEDHFDLGTAV